MKNIITYNGSTLTRETHYQTITYGGMWGGEPRQLNIRTAPDTYTLNGKEITKEEAQDFIAQMNNTTEQGR